MKINEVLKKTMEEYIDKKAREAYNKESSLYRLVCYESRDIVKDVVDKLSLKINLQVKASCGSGGWTRYPWIAIFNREITTTIQEGIYIVYLFSEDMKRLYLTINQGCTNLNDKLGKKQARIEMRKIREEFRDKYPSNLFKKDNDLKVGNSDYEQGCIYYKEYFNENFPSQELLKEDLDNIIKIYNEYYYKEVREEPFFKKLGVEKMNEENNLNKSVSMELQIKHIKKYINNKGFIYSYEDLCNFYLSLKTKPFVILAGISGTGKSKLVKLFSEAIGATSLNNQYNLISVKPDWNDSTELLGYKNLNDEFIKGKLTEIIIEASKEENKNKPYFICLDEMNLARVEYYLSEYLSLIETRAINESGSVITDLIFPKSLCLDDSLKDLIIPDNLYVVGTVNMDDTTFSFSRKVLDRANTIEFSNVNLELLSFEEDNSISKFYASNDILRTSFLNIKDALKVDKEFVENINKKIIELNNILKLGNKQFGYRVRDEIVFYMVENKLENLLSEEIAFDYQIMQKILPTISGSELAIKNILIGLYNYCNPSNEIADGIDYITEALKGLNEALYKKSAEKIIMMLRGYEDGFTSFWL